MKTLLVVWISPNCRRSERFVPTCRSRAGSKTSRGGVKAEDTAVAVRRGWGGLLDGGAEGWEKMRTKSRRIKEQRTQIQRRTEATGVFIFTTAVLVAMETPESGAGPSPRLLTEALDPTSWNSCNYQAVSAFIGLCCSGNKRPLPGCNNKSNGDLKPKWKYSVEILM